MVALIRGVSAQVRARPGSRALQEWSLAFARLGRSTSGTR